MKLPALLKFPALCAVLLATVSLHAAAADIAMKPEQMQALGVRTERLGMVAGQHMGELRLPGRIMLPPDQMRVVAAPASGVVSEVKVAVNDPVAAGQLLARLLSPDLVAAQKDLVQAAAQNRLARENYARDKQLLDEGIIAASRYQTARSNLAQAQAALAQQRQTLKLMGVPAATINAMEAGRGVGAGLALTAPMAGVVLESRVTPGQRVDASAPLFTLARLDPLWVDLEVPVAQAAGVEVGAQVRVGLMSGRVVTVGRMAGTSQTVTVRARLEGMPQHLVVGQAVEVRMQVTAAGWALPVAAVVRFQGRDYVFAATVDGFRPVAVTVTARTPETLWVQGALAPGQAVAVVGTAQIKAIWTGVGGE